MNPKNIMIDNEKGRVELPLNVWIEILSTLDEVRCFFKKLEGNQFNNFVYLKGAGEALLWVQLRLRNAPLICKELLFEIDNYVEKLDSDALIDFRQKIFEERQKFIV